MDSWRVRLLIVCGALTASAASAQNPYQSYRFAPLPPPVAAESPQRTEISPAPCFDDAADSPIVPSAFSASPAGVGGNACSAGSRPQCLPRSCDSDATQVFDVFYGYDAWRGVPDGAWTNNGVHFGANLGTRLGPFSDVTGIGLQVGGTIGVYDWAGTDYRLDNQNKATTQGLLTYGLYRRAADARDWTAAIANDWMLNANYSVMGEDMVLWQWRAQLGYVFDDANEWGFWGSWRGHGETQRVMYFGDVTWQPINQLHLYWHHKWSAGGADTWIMFGVPERDRLAGGGSLGDYIAGAYSFCPLNDHFMLYSMVNYMHQSARPGDPGAREEAWNFYIGVAFYPQALARSCSVQGHRWAPLLPVANNGLFLVDASRTY